MSEGRATLVIYYIHTPTIKRDSPLSTEACRAFYRHDPPGSGRTRVTKVPLILIFIFYRLT